MVHDNYYSTVPIIGAWRLISFEIHTDDDRVLYPFSEDARGSIIYSESGRFTAQVMRRKRPKFASGDQMKGTQIEIKANYEGVVSYFGSFEFNPEGGYVIHHVEGSLFPNWEGNPQKRFFELEGKRLKLSTPPILWGGGEIIGVLVWERVDA